VSATLVGLIGLKLLNTKENRNLNCGGGNKDRLCDPEVRVPGYRSRGPGSIPGATTFSE
jgi:hypothetical protein